MMIRTACVLFAVLACAVLPVRLASASGGGVETPSPAAEAPSGWPPAVVEAMFAAAHRPGDAFDDLLLARALRGLIPTGPDEPPAPGTATKVAATATMLERRALASATGDWRAMALLLTDPRDLQFDADAMADALAAAQPDNGYAHVVLVSRAWRSESPARFVAAIGRAAAATDYRALFPLAADALRRRIGRDDAETALLATATAAATVLPAYQDVGRPCREATGTIAEQCLAFGQLLAREGDTVIDVGIGAGLVDALGTPEQKAEATALREAAHALFDRALPLTVGLEHDGAAFTTWLAKSAELGELGALRWMLETHGGAVPPAEG